MGAPLVCVGGCVDVGADVCGRASCVCVGGCVDVWVDVCGCASCVYEYARK